MRQARLRNEAVETNRDLTFKPKVSEATRRIVEGRSAAAASGKKTAAQQAADRAREARLARAAAARREEHSFKPHLPSKSEELVATNPEFQKHTDFLKRSRSWDRRREEQLEETAEEAAKRNAASFEPSLPPKSAAIAEKQPWRRSESKADKMVRLSYGDAQQRAEVAEVAAAEYYAQFRYEPELAEGSKKRAQPTPLGQSTPPLAHDPSCRAVLLRRAGGGVCVCRCASLG